MNQTIKTKFGSASINADGYYQIKSINEGNRGKLLHRLIYEDFWGVKLPPQISIHHKDFNKLNNCILNLEAMTISDHQKLHHEGENNIFKGITLTKEHKQKISNSMKGKFKGENHPMYGKKHEKIVGLHRSMKTTSSGIYNVHKRTDKSCKQGFIWVYVYEVNGAKKTLCSVDLDKLESKVRSKGLEWVKLDEVCDEVNSW